MGGRTREARRELDGSMTLAELLYRIQGELDGPPEDSTARVLFVTGDGKELEPFAAAPSYDPGLNHLTINLVETSWGMR